MLQTVFNANIGRTFYMRNSTLHNTHMRTLVSHRYRVDDYYINEDSRTPSLFISYAKNEIDEEMEIPIPVLMQYIHFLFGWECNLPSMATRPHDNSQWIDINEFVDYSLSDLQVIMLIKKHTQS